MAAATGAEELTKGQEMMFKHCIYKAIFGLNTNAEPFTVSEQMKPQGTNHTILTQNYVYSDVCSDAAWLQKFL